MRNARRKQTPPGNGWTNLTTDKKVRPLLARQSEIRAALDEVQTAILTNDITDVARLCGVLESYPFRQSPETGMLTECIDWHVEKARFWVYEILCKPFTRTLALPKICQGLEYALQLVVELIDLSICNK